MSKKQQLHEDSFPQPVSHAQHIPNAKPNAASICLSEGSPLADSRLTQSFLIDGVLFGLK